MLDYSYISGAFADDDYYEDVMRSLRDEIDPSEYEETYEEQMRKLFKEEHAQDLDLLEDEDDDGELEEQLFQEFLHKQHKILCHSCADRGCVNCLL